VTLNPYMRLLHFLQSAMPDRLCRGPGPVNRKGKPRKGKRQRKGKRAAGC